jgi:hypothetical protein
VQVAGFQGSLRGGRSYAVSFRLTRLAKQRRQTIAPGNPRSNWPSAASLILWGLVGLAAGFVVGAIGPEVSGHKGLGESIVNIRVEIFGVTIRQGFGPESMSEVFWTWGFAVIGTFAWAGAVLFMAARVAFAWIMTVAQTGMTGEARQSVGTWHDAPTRTKSQ